MMTISAIDPPTAQPAAPASVSNQPLPSSLQKQTDVAATAAVTSTKMTTTASESTNERKDRNDEETDYAVMMNELTCLNRSHQQQQQQLQQNQQHLDNSSFINLIEKSVIIHRDENGFGLRVKGQGPLFVEHVHENGAAWRAGVRKFDLISKVNGAPVGQLDHKEVVLMFKSCSRFVGLTLLSSHPSAAVSLYSASAASTSCLHQRDDPNNSSDINNNANNQFQPDSLCAARAAAAATNEENDDVGEDTDDGDDREATSVVSRQCACHQRRRRVFLAPSASSRTLLSLDLNLGSKRHQQRHVAGQIDHHHRHHPHSQYQLLSGMDGRGGENGRDKHLDCAESNDHHHHSSTAIVSSTNKGQRYHDLAATLLTDKPRSASQIPADNCSRLQESAATATTRRSESVSYKPCYLSVPESSSSKLNGAVDSGTCICVSCRSLLHFATSETNNERDREQLQQLEKHHHQQQQQQQRENMDTCEQCRMIRLSAGFSRLSHRFSRRQRSQQLDCSTNHFVNLKNSPSQQATTAAAVANSANKMQQQQQQQEVVSSKKKYPPTAREPPHYKITQSASTNSLPTESQRVKNGVGRKNATNQQPATATVATNASQTPARASQTNKRLEIIREFIDTEKTHTDRLRCLDELFYRPLKTGGFLTSEQLRMVFSCHRTLYKIHRQIYRILVSVNYNHYHSEPLIGSALIEIFEGELKRRLERAACNFCAIQSSNAELLNKLTRRDTKVGEFLAHVTSQQMVGRLGIKDLLASCFQRLTKYPLLLENLLKATPLGPPPPLPLPETVKRTPEGACRVNSSIEGDDEEFGSQEADEDEDDECRKEQEEEELVEDEEQRRRRKAAEDSQRIMAISLAEEREFIERALQQSRQILVKVNDSVKVAISHNKLKEIWKRTDKYPGVPLIDITKQQVVHEGFLTLRLSKRSFDVYVLLLTDYLIILTREGQDKYRLKFFTPEGKSSSSSSSASGPNVYSPVFVIDEHLTTRDAATDENGFYLLCKRKDDSRIYEFASRSPAERSRWRDKIQWTIERQMGKSQRRRSSCESAITKSSSEISSNRGDANESATTAATLTDGSPAAGPRLAPTDVPVTPPASKLPKSITEDEEELTIKNGSGGLSTKIEGTISLVEDDGIIQPYKMESTQALVDQAVQVNICDMRSDKSSVNTAAAT